MLENLYPVLVMGAVVLLALLVIGIIIVRLYQRASKELSFVRTGLGGQKVVMDGGAIVLPGFHQVIPVNMNTLKLEVSRSGKDSLFTKDRMRVDAVAAFFVRVRPMLEGIAQAAQTLGQRTMDPSALKELVEDKFVDALRAAAVSMTMQELLDKRQDFIQAVQNTVQEDLTKNGLELESVSLTRIDQTAMQFFDPNNAFDAEGLTKLTEETQLRTKQRNAIEQDTAVEIAEKNLTTKQEQLRIAQQQTLAVLAQEQEVANKQAEQSAQVAGYEAVKKQESEQARITAERQVKEAEVERDRSVKQKQIEAERGLKVAAIEQQRSIEIAEQERAIAIAQKSEQQSVAEAQANLARAEAVKAAQSVVTAEEVARAEREKQVSMVKAEEDAQRRAIEMTVAAEAERQAAEDQAHAIRTLAEANATNYEVEAEGKRKLNDAVNVLSPEQIAMNVKIELIRALPAIIAASVKPMERIEGIKIIQVDGLNRTGGGGHAAESTTNGNLAEQAVSAALAYRAQQPLIDSLLNEVGITEGLSGRIGASLFAPPNPPAQSTLTQEG
ncbi:flotillin family protein [Thiobacillus sp.]|uniref:flotillin family protein n=1 Tax=Thiobacillus sp. TaxID=924 RepID=UPI0025DB8DC6|nr:flotillin family protein [Thiobacillus sp.]MBT9539554.1 flotillin family protein [Thiobacillus sp.]